MSLISVITGQENQMECHARIHVFHTPTDACRAFDEMPLSRFVTVVGGEEICRKHGAPTIFEAVDGYRGEVGGTWYQQQYEIREGELLKIFASLKKDWNSVPAIANLFVRIRANAPLMKVRVKLLGKANSKLDHGEIIGRMDVLTLQEAKDRGAIINPLYTHYYAEHNVQKLFTYEELEGAVVEMAGFETTQTDTGKTVKIRKRSRSIEL
jgi:hypothetical protein